MNNLNVLVISTIIIAFTHTFLGPDHYLPFIAFSKSKNWSLKKTLNITLFCGIIHLLSAFLIGFLAIYFKSSLENFAFFERIKSDITAWLLISFGIVYFVWGLNKVIKNKIYKKSLTGSKKYLNSKTIYTFLIIVFIIGPCEPLIPLVLFPSVSHSYSTLFLIATIFSITTIITMLSIVSLSFVKFNIKLKLNVYRDVIAGFIIFICGVGIKFLGF